MIILCLADASADIDAITRCFQDETSFVNLGEIFYCAADGVGHYVKRWETADPPSLERFVEYLGILRSDAEHLYWLDIKFHDLGRFNPLQRSLIAPPAMLQQILKVGDPTVLIGCANPLRVATSGLQGKKLGAAYLCQMDELKDKPVELERRRSMTVAAIRQALERQTELRVVEGYLRTHPRLFRVDHEALFDCLEAAENRALLGAWIGVANVIAPDARIASRSWPDWFDCDLAGKILQETSGQWWLE